MKSILTTIFVLVFAAADSVSLQKARNSHCRAITKLATYDNIPTGPAVIDKSVGTYMNIQYNGFDAIQTRVNGTVLTGLVPESGDQVAVTGVLHSIIEGAPALSPALPYKDFELLSTFFECTVNTVASLSGAPEPCTVVFTAYKPGKTVAFDTINEQFNPATPTLSNLTEAIFPQAWSNLGKVEIAIVASTVATDSLALFLDNTRYRLFTCE